MKQDIEINASSLPSNFYEKCIKSGQPLIIKGGIREWPAYLNWTPEYFKENFPNRVVDIAVSENNFFSYSGHHRANLKIESLKLKDAFGKIKGKQDKHYYMVHQDFAKYYPELLKDILPIQSEVSLDNYEIKFWAGSEGNVTPLHYDMYHNFLVQIFGKKRVKLFSPSDNDFLYPSPPGNPSNHSLVTSIDKYDVSMFPLFKNAKTYYGELEAGDILFIPAGWWHQVYTESLSITLSFWWRPMLQEILPAHLLRHIASYLYKNDMFDKIHDCINFSGFKDYFDIAHYLFKTKNYWLSCLFSMYGVKQYIHKICHKFNISIYNDKGFKVLGTHEISLLELNSSIGNFAPSLKVDEKLVMKWMSLVEASFLENNDKLLPSDIAEILNVMCKLEEQASQI